MENRNLQDAKEALDLEITNKSPLSPAELGENLRILKNYDDEIYKNYLNSLSLKSLANIAMEVPDHMLEDIISSLPYKKIAKAISKLESDDKTELLKNIGELDALKAKEIFLKLGKKDQEDILKLARYDDNEAGAYMQTEIFSANLDDDLHTAIKKLRILKKSRSVEIFRLFVVDNENLLKYSIGVDELILYDFNMTLKDIVSSNEKFQKTYAVNDNDKIEDVIKKFDEFDLSVIPVVDSNGILLGRITTDDIHDVIQEIATEQIYNLAGSNVDVEDNDTLKGSIRARAIWLFINLGTAMLGSSVVGIFDDTIANIVALAVLMPIVSAMGGNAGTQALAVTVRKLALGEIEFSDIKEVLKKEILIAISNGVIFATLLGIVTIVWFKIPLLGLVIALSMIINMFCAGLFGALIPMILKFCKIDPAVGSSILLTGITDIVGFFSFLGLATAILK